MHSNASIQIELRNVNEAPTLAGHTPYAHVCFEVAADPSAKHWSDDPVRGFYLPNLHIGCQIDARDHNPQSDSCGPSYAWEVAYIKPFTVGMDEATKMLKTLKLLDQRLEKLRDQFGSPRSYGGYVARLATVLQAHLVFYEQYPNGRRFEKHRVAKPGEAINFIDALVLDHWRACRKLAGKSETFAIPEPEAVNEPSHV